jgi:hypothetical protein
MGFKLNYVAIIIRIKLFASCKLNNAKHYRFHKIHFAFGVPAGIKGAAKCRRHSKQTGIAKSQKN